MAEPLSYQPVTAKEIAEARRSNSALLMSIGAVSCIVVACFGNGMAQRFRNHGFELLNFLWLPSIALVIRASALSVTSLRSRYSSRCNSTTLVICAIYVFLLIVWALWFAPGV